MSTFTKSATLAAVLAAASIMASAAIAPASGVGRYGEKTVALQGGSTLHIYKDGKTAVENAYGHPAMVASGQKLHEQNGTTIAMNGDEVGRLASELRTHR